MKFYMIHVSFLSCFWQKIQKPPTIWSDPGLDNVGRYIHYFPPLTTLISLINVEPTLTNFEKFHPPKKKNPPPRLLISLLKCLILLQNLMTIFLTNILSYKTLFYHKNWCLLPPPHLVNFHFWHPFTFIREMRVDIQVQNDHWGLNRLVSRLKCTVLAWPVPHCHFGLVYYLR